MLRLAFVQLLFFLIPFAVYALYLYLSKKGAVGDRESWSGVGGWLVIGGLACAFIGMVSLALFDRADPDAIYIPAHVEDGKLIPDTFKPAPHPENGQ
ncbi:MAG: hypothetical protein KDJ77_16640 [Rhodobiaceae bacterium]|nr:hypothetical protein [Rhodobiaceae bacterium]